MSLVEACGCGELDQEIEALPQMLPAEEEVVDVDFSHPTLGQIRGDIQDMSSEEAFIAGFLMGQSGDFDDIISGDMVDDDPPEDMEIIPDTASIVPYMTEGFDSSEEIETALLAALSDLGGAGSLTDLQGALTDVTPPEDFDLEAFLVNSEKVSKHPDGDWVSGDVDAGGVAERRNRSAFVELQPLSGPSTPVTEMSTSALWSKLAGIN
jgi:hypothetical protein